MDNLTFDKIKEALSKYNNLAVAVPIDPTVDEMGAALGLYLSLKDMGKAVSIATPNTPLVEVSALVGIDEVRTTLGEASGDLVVSFPYREGEIEKVSYTRDDNFLNIVVKAGEKGLNFTEQEVRFSRGSKAPELLFIVGAARVSDLGKLFDPAVLKDTVVVNIDNKPDNQGYGDIVMVSNRFSSISEAVVNLILTVGAKLDLDIAENLMLGIATATNNFQDPKTSSLAFEMAGVLMRNGALRPTPNQPKRNDIPMDFAGEQFAAPQPVLPKNPFKPQPPRPAQVQPKPFSQQQPRPSSPIQSTQVRAAEQMRDQLLKQQEQAPIEQVEGKEASGMGENPPDDWLTPKIYKGSTNF
jgi:Exopolyphosphatase-related proteins